MWHYCCLSPRFVDTIQPHSEYPSKPWQLVPCDTTAVSVQGLWTPYHHAPVYSIILFAAHVCLAVTCRLHFWQNGQDLLWAVTQGWNGHWMSQSRKLILGERILLLLLLSPCVFNCDLPPALLAEWPGSFMHYCSNTGLKWIPNESAQKAATPAETQTPKIYLFLFLALGQIILTQIYYVCFIFVGSHQGSEGHWKNIFWGPVCFCNTPNLQQLPKKRNQFNWGTFTNPQS